MSLSSRLIARLFKLPPATGRRVVCEVDLRIPMPDGTVLLANRTAPVDGYGLPIVLIRTPYTPRGKKPDVTSRLLAERGYQVVFQNCRGTFGSGGEYEPLRNERGDGLATLKWLGDQPWFGGAVGMFGPSYLAYVQLASAPGAPDYLRALVPHAGSSRIYGIKRNDPFRFNVALTWVYQQFVMHFADSPAKRMRAMLRRDRVLRKGFDRLPVGAADRNALGSTVPYFQNIIANEHPDDEFWAEMDHSRIVKDIDAPTHFIGCWHDFFLADQLADYQAMRAAGKNPYLTICPGGHASFTGLSESFAQGLRWFEVHLRNKPDAARSLPVRICVTGTDSWTELESWPPPSTPVKWFLHPEGRLSTGRPDSGTAQPSRYTYDPADPTPRVGGRVVFDGGPQDNRKLEARSDVLTFTSEPLAHNTTVIGEVTAELYVRSSLGHTDFFARLCDVSARGKSINICDGIVRLTPQAHGDSDVRRIAINLQLAGHCFRAGHKIRLQVSSGAHPMHARNLGTGESLATGTSMKAADQEVFHDVAHPSAVTLPLGSAGR